MIQEVIVTTQNIDGTTHLDPMGVHIIGNKLIILPFQPSTTLDNILRTKTAVINYTDDVRIFAGCLTGRYQWNLSPTLKIAGYYLTTALAHKEVKLTQVEDDSIRPKLFCHTLHSVNHAPFQGFNRAQFAVLEAAILASRLNRLSVNKIQTELAYLQIAIDKTAGKQEQQAWNWLMELINQHTGVTHL